MKTRARKQAMHAAYAQRKAAKKRGHQPDTKRSQNVSGSTPMAVPSHPFPLLALLFPRQTSSKHPESIFQSHRRKAA